MSQGLKTLKTRRWSALRVGLCCKEVRILGSRLSSDSHHIWPIVELWRRLCYRVEVSRESTEECGLSICYNQNQNRKVDRMASEETGWEKHRYSACLSFLVKFDLLNPAWTSGPNSHSPGHFLWFGLLGERILAMCIWHPVYLLVTCHACL